MSYSVNEIVPLYIDVFITMFIITKIMYQLTRFLISP